MSGFRLREYGPTGGPVTLSAVYDDLNQACTVAERIIDALERYPHRRPHTIHVIDVWTGEIVTQVSAHNDPDPFGPVLPLAEPTVSGPPFPAGGGQQESGDAAVHFAADARASRPPTRPHDP